MVLFRSSSLKKRKKADSVTKVEGKTGRCWRLMFLLHFIVFECFTQFDWRLHLHMICTASTASLKECAVPFTVSNVRGNKFFLDVMAV